MIYKNIYCVKHSCDHLNGTDKQGVPICKAFPKGIPPNILLGKTPHTKVVEEQEGGYVVTPILKEG